MANCIKCNYAYPPKELTDGLCRDCKPKEISDEFKKELAIRNELVAAKELEDKLKLEKYNSIILTTEMFIKEDIERIKLVTSECVYGINIVKDFFAGIRDIVGGNVKSIEKSLRDARDHVMNDIQKQAFELDGDAVIAIKLEHSYGKSMMSMFATGTVVKFKKVDL